MAEVRAVVTCCLAAVESQDDLSTRTYQILRKIITG